MHGSAPAKEVCKVVSPLGTTGVKMVPPAPRLKTLEGKTICEIWNEGFKGDETFPILRGMLRERYPTIKIIPYTEFPLTSIESLGPATIEKVLGAVREAILKNACDAVITGNGAWGTCTPAAARPAAIAEKLGIPSVVIAATTFLPLVVNTGKSEGVSGLRFAEYPGTSSVESAATMRENFKNMTFEQVIKALTKQLEKIEVEAKVRGPGDIVFKGTIEEVNNFFHANMWTDGMAIIPPTIERVEEFLKYTDLPPDKEIAILPVANLRATPCVPPHIVLPNTLPNIPRFVV